jgi:schlafen family protein
VEKLVKQLVERRKEGSWWDFKREHHECSLDLLHDILCLSNAIHSGDRYLIIGVSDDYEFIDVRSNNPRRRQSDVIDLLKAKKFAEDNVPIVTLETIYINDNEIDVIVIKNERVKPYYLLSDERKGKKTLKCGVVYSRVGDTNTPVDKCANPNDVAVMWRERFGLTLSVEERFITILLDYENWRYDGVSKAFYSLEPDYSIEIEEDENVQGKYWWQIDFFEKPVGSTYILKYKDKELYKLLVQRFHSENLCFPFPNVEYVAYPDDQITNVECYCDLFFYVKGTIKYSLFVHVRALEIGAKLNEFSLKTPIKTQIKPPIINLPFLIFEDNSSKDKAIEMLKQNINEYKALSADGNKCEKLFSEWAYNQVNGE